MAFYQILEIAFKKETLLGLAQGVTVSGSLAEPTSSALGVSICATAVDVK